MRSVHPVQTWSLLGLLLSLLMSGVISCQAVQLRQVSLR